MLAQVWGGTDSRLASRLWHAHAGAEQFHECNGLASSVNLSPPFPQKILKQKDLTEYTSPIFESCVQRLQPVTFEKHVD